MKREGFGTDGKGNAAELITLSNKNGVQVKISTLGATVVSFLCKDKNGIVRDIVLGYENAEAYLEHNGYYFGATVGRNANRIKGARVTIDGREYRLEANSGENNLHSGSNGVSHRLWEIEDMDESKNSVAMKIFSADLEQGFPGNMNIKVTFALSEENELRISYEAVSDKDTLANFTNHSYFNLAGHDGGYIGSQKLKIYAKEFTALAPEGSVPSGEILPVKGTPLDFGEFKEIGKEIDADYDQLQYVRGYDQNFLLENNGQLQIMAEAVCEETGIHLYAYTDCPGFQLYTANFVDEHKGKGGAVYGERHGFCLESQYVPDACHNPQFKNPLLKAGEMYKSETVYQLKVD